MKTWPAPLPLDDLTDHSVPRLSGKLLGSRAGRDRLDEGVTALGASAGADVGEFLRALALLAAEARLACATSGRR